MLISGETVKFKSIDTLYVKEKSGIKPYTIRILTVQEMHAFRESSPTWIRIVQSKTAGHEYFEREITDTSLIGKFIGRYMLGIAWRHPDGEQGVEIRRER